MPSDVAALLDTNVLVYASDGASPHHASSRALRDGGAAGSVALGLTTQILLEYVAVVTNPKRVASPCSSEEAWTEVAKLGAAFPILAPPPDHVRRVEELGRQVKHRGAEVFDLAIATTMLAAGVHEIYTFDGTIFARVPGITVKRP
jgi:hypothetical protein